MAINFPSAFSNFPSINAIDFVFFITFAVEILSPTVAELKKLTLISNVKTNTSDPHFAIQARAIMASIQPVINPPCTIPPE